MKVEGIYHHWPLKLCSACGNPHSSFLGWNQANGASRQTSEAVYPKSTRLAVTEGGDCCLGALDSLLFLLLTSEPDQKRGLERPTASLHSIGALYSP